jgi:hypothetical protein
MAAADQSRSGDGSLELATGKTDRPLPDRSVRQYDISPDEREVAFTTRTPEGVLEIWL